MTDTIVFDLDDTICYPNLDQPDTKQRYGNAQPNGRVISIMQRLKAKGYHIIIHSARRMVTHNGDIDKIESDVGQVTKDWLKFYGVPYDDLIFGKPYASTYYVDDKAMNLKQLYEWVSDEDSNR